MLAEVVSLARPAGPWNVRLRGHSMHPLVREGDDLLVHPQVGSPRFGDVVVFPHNEILIAHRVIGIGKTVLTAGDASRGARECVDPKLILGTVREVRRSGRIIHSSLSNPARALLLRVRLALKYHLRLRR